MRFAALRSILLAALLVPIATPSFGASPGCPSDIRAALIQDCPCTGFRNHGKFMTCIRQQLGKLRQSGCDESHLKGAVNCLNESTCGKVHKPVVCCTKTGRAKILSPTACTDRGGQAMAGTTSLCDAACVGAHVPNVPK
ncbi:MAG: hypothetical protein HY270_12815 [Deltaproteobacteria bacterium]|nr:hypothetical protein [Deltaproteobacteria bacterium]